jgi:5'-3' exonuclease
MTEFEADDALASAARKYRRSFEQVVIASPDKDLAQCVRGREVVLWDRRRDLLYDEAGVEEKYGVPPASIPDWLALVGDAADGLPGIPGWGAKSSATVLRAWRRLERIPADPAHWNVDVRGGARLAAALAAQRDDARLYRELATLRTDVPLSQTKRDLEWRGVPRARWEAVCAELGFGRLATRPRRFAEADGRKA